MVGQVNNQTPTLRPTHEQRRACMILKCLLEAKQIPTCVGDPPKKPTTKNKIELLSFQKVGPELGANGLAYLVMSFETW